MSNIDFFKKYYPKSSNELIGNKDEIEKIKEWLEITKKRYFSFRRIIDITKDLQINYGVDICIKNFNELNEVFKKILKNKKDKDWTTLTDDELNDLPLIEHLTCETKLKKILNCNIMIKLNQNQNLKKKLIEFINLNKFLIPKKNDYYNAIIITGIPGCGKTTCAKILTKDDFDVSLYNAGDQRSKTSIQEKIIKIYENTNIFQTQNIKPPIIIMDEVDGMSTGDKGGVASLINIINPDKGIRSNKKLNNKSFNKNWIIPIICIANYNYKKVSELKKICLDIQFENPSMDELYDLANKININENLNLDSESLIEIIIDSQMDIRKLIQLLKEVYDLNINNCKYGKFDFNNYEKKDLDTDLYIALQNLFTNNITIKDSMNLYELNKSMTPLIIQDNITTILNIDDNDNDNEIKLLKIIANITSNVSDGDVINRHIYTNQGWELQNIFGFFSVVLPSILLRRYIDKHIYNDTIRNSIKYNNVFGNISMVSLRDSKIGNIKTMISNIGNSGNLDVISLLKDKLFLLLFNTNSSNSIDDQKNALKLLKEYNLDVKDLDNFFKLNNFYTDKDKTRELTFKKKYNSKKFIANLNKLNGESIKIKKIVKKSSKM
jgi:DNA polymerase III delta prime subunit